MQRSAFDSAIAVTMEPDGKAFKFENRVVEPHNSELNSVVLSHKGSGRNGWAYKVVFLVMLGTGESQQEGDQKISVHYFMKVAIILKCQTNSASGFQPIPLSKTHSDVLYFKYMARSPDMSV